MPEQLQNILNRILEWWKKFNTKQKALLVSITAAVLLALGILAAVVSQPNMVPLVVCQDTKESGQVKSLLDGDSSVKYEMSSDGLTFYVDEKDYAVASILLGTNNIPSSGYDIESVFSGGFSATEADKDKRYKSYMQDYMGEKLAVLSNVESAVVNLDIPNNDGTILSQQQEAHAGVMLTLTGDGMTDEQAAGLAQYIATQLGNDTTDHITIMDSDCNILFSGGESSSAVGMANSQLSLQTKNENLITSKVRNVMLGSSLFDHVEVSSKLDMDFSSRRTDELEFSAPDGQTNGMIGEESSYEEITQGGISGVPGTNTNGDDTTYVFDDNNYSSSTITDTSRRYQNNQKRTTTESGVGEINYENSSIAIVAKRYVKYDEDTLRASGALEDITFEEYIAQNSEPVRVDVDPDYYTMVANATGFPAESISILAYEEPIFQRSAGGRSISDYFQIALAVLIFALLGYVVFRSTRKEKTEELEEELSVESLLESTKESQDKLEDIGYNEKSETRVLIEKFVEENPEAVASLLRNWLNEEWE